MEEHSHVVLGVQFLHQIILCRVRALQLHLLCKVFIFFNFFQFTLQRWRSCEKMAPPWVRKLIGEKGWQKGDKTQHLCAVSPMNFQLSLQSLQSQD